MESTVDFKQKRVLSRSCFNYKWMRIVVKSVIREEKGFNTKTGTLAKDGPVKKCTPPDYHKDTNFK